MEKLKEIRMTLVILIVGLFFISGCFFNDNKTVSFKTNGGSEIKNITVKNGSKIEEAPIPTKDGYIFDGWYLDGQEYNFDKSIDEDITLVAKWIRETSDNAQEEVTTEPTGAAETTNEKTTTKKVESSTSKKLTTPTSSKKKTTKAKTTKKSTTTTTTTAKRVVTTTTTTASPTTTTTRPILSPDEDKPKPTLPVVVGPTEPVNPNPEEPVVKHANMKVVVFGKCVETDEVKCPEETEEYIKVTKTNEESNVISNIDDLDLSDLEMSDPNTWLVISNHAYIYEYLSENGIIELKGDKDVTSFTVVFNGTSIVFDYDELDNTWVIKYPTVSVGTGLDTIYYSDLKTAVSVAKENDTIKLLADQELTDNLVITKPITIDADNHKVTNKEGYLFNLEEMKYSKDSKFEVNNLVLEVDSFIYVGKSKFDNIVLNNVTGNIKNEKIDKKENGEFENTSILQHF